MNSNYTGVSFKRTIKRVEKGWGHELWIVNKSEYCGKLLFFREGKKCSWHFHKLKDEVFYLHSGKILLKYSLRDNIEEAEELILNPGDSFHVLIGLRHQMLALEESELFEFSTEHFDSDSYRIIRGD
jgi:quercetin dioxygenase-like cupin family protein